MNDQNLQPFKKGPDPRRNLRGVPKDAIAARKLIRRIGAELVKLPKDSEGYEREITRFELMIRAMFGSKAPADRQNILKSLAPGLLKDELDIKVTVSQIIDAVGRMKQSELDELIKQFETAASRGFAAIPAGDAAAEDPGGGSPADPDGE